MDVNDETTSNRKDPSKAEEGQKQADKEQSEATMTGQAWGAGAEGGTKLEHIPEVQKACCRISGRQVQDSLQQLQGRVFACSLGQSQGRLVTGTIVGHV